MYEIEIEVEETHTYMLTHHSVVLYGVCLHVEAMAALWLVEHLPVSEVVCRPACVLDTKLIDESALLA